MVYPTLSFSYLAITTSLFPFQSVKRNTFFLRFIHRKGFNKGMKGDYSFSILFWKLHVIPLIINHCVLRWVLSDNLICFLSLCFFSKKNYRNMGCVYSSIHKTGINWFFITLRLVINDYVFCQFSYLGLLCFSDNVHVWRNNSSLTQLHIEKRSWS